MFRVCQHSSVIGVPRTSNNEIGRYDVLSHPSVNNFRCNIFIKYRIEVQCIASSGLQMASLSSAPAPAQHCELWRHCTIIGSMRAVESGNPPHTKTYNLQPLKCVTFCIWFILIFISSQNLYSIFRKSDWYSMQ